MRSRLPSLDYGEYTTTWDRVAKAGLRELNIDAWAAGRRYLSLATLVLSSAEASQLRDVTTRFGGLLDAAVDGILADPDWWSALAWPWPAIELARQEPTHPNGRASLFGRFDCLLDHRGTWQVIEFNADTPSGGRESSGYEPAIARLPSNDGLRRLHTTSIGSHLETAIRQRVAQHARRVRCIGIVSSHTWLEDMAQATWLARRLERAGLAALVGDVTDLAADGDRILLRGQRIDALYRFYPVERLYRHAVFASLCEAALDGRLLLLNGLRAFLAQSKACLAWLWSNRSVLDVAACDTIERHLPRTILARDPAALDLLADGVIKHVNGREGDSVVFGRTLAVGAPEWEGRLLEGGYVIQRAVEQVTVEDVEVDDLLRRVTRVAPKFACVGAFTIDGAFSGCYTRLDGPITTARATYVATLHQTT
ncbi:MAG TPA: glutathionylspermidine synthase family protein [Chloroflexota bacterium]|nr:glutathionylspermidine synthase family protein [Chloroflexota bacterium]